MNSALFESLAFSLHHILPAMKESTVMAGCGIPAGRITRARAAAFDVNGVALPLKSPLITKADKKQRIRWNSKRACSDENNLAAAVGAANPQKKRITLKDVSNICCETSNKNCIDITRKQSHGNNLNSTLGASFQQKKRVALIDVSNIYHENSSKNCSDTTRKQSRASKRFKLDPSKGNLHANSKDPKLAISTSRGRSSIQDESKNKMVEVILDMGMISSQKTTASLDPEKNSLASKNVESIRDGKNKCNTIFSEEHNSKEELNDNLESGTNNLCEDPWDLTSLDYIDIDSDNANPQMCSLYAQDIYTNLRASELSRRPCSDYMESVQRDITQSMRGILIDWLVEVSEEYKLVPDTLHLTVHIIDRFLSQNFVERQRLQLLGITCMLIASKYEEICAPCVEELCFITDNTYTKEQVLKMEIQVLKYLRFQLSVPTVNTFLRRFLRAAQASCKVSTPVLGHLAKYLAELTLVEYSFLKFLPSVTAASAVFLARWTVDQSCHPWDLTLQHYSSYKASDLKAAVFALQDLQMNVKNCSLNAMREKYRQEKFKAVASLTSPELLPSLFF